MKRYKITVNGQSYDVQVEETGGAASTGAPAPAIAPSAPAAAPAPAAAAPSGAAGAPGTGKQVVKAPMPGTLMSYKVAVGTAVKKGSVVLILEAMKMENEIVATADGTVVALLCSEGASVNTGDPLIELS